MFSLCPKAGELYPYKKKLQSFQDIIDLKIMSLLTEQYMHLSLERKVKYKTYRQSRYRLALTTIGKKIQSF